MKRILSGIQASGEPHIGNYFGMMKPMIDLQNDPNNKMFIFIADFHAFTSKRSPEEFSNNLKNVILDFLALGVDPEKSIFYRQSDIAAHTELSWFLCCQTPMGILERGHAFKDKVANGISANVGLFTYPVLMTADILLYDINIVPVGKDQKQHVEMARDIAGKFNHEFGETFILPEPQIDENVQTIPGLDGAKMSKSYGNTIPIFGTEKQMKKAIMSIKTDSVELGDPINPDTCNVMAFHKLFDNPNYQKLEMQYRAGEIGFGESKKQLFELIWNYFSEARERREKFENDPEIVHKILKKGAEKANEIASQKLSEVREKLGLDFQSILQA